jgi:hypothetical protein
MKEIRDIIKHGIDYQEQGLKDFSSLKLKKAYLRIDSLIKQYEDRLKMNSIKVIND